MTSPQGGRRVRGDAGVTRGGRVVKKLGFWGDVIYGRPQKNSWNSRFRSRKIVEIFKPVLKVPIR